MEFRDFVFEILRQSDHEFSIDQQLLPSFFLPDHLFSHFDFLFLHFPQTDVFLMPTRDPYWISLSKKDKFNQILFYLKRIFFIQCFHLGVPKDLVGKKLKAPDSCFMRNGDLLMIKFVDKKASGDKEIYVVDSKGIAGIVQVERFEKGMSYHLLLSFWFLICQVEQKNISRNHHQLLTTIEV